MTPQSACKQCGNRTGCSYFGIYIAKTIDSKTENWNIGTSRGYNHKSSYVTVGRRQVPLCKQCQERTFRDWWIGAIRPLWISALILFLIILGIFLSIRYQSFLFLADEPLTHQFYTDIPKRFVDHNTPLSNYVWNQFAPTTQQALTAYVGGPKPNDQKAEWEIEQKAKHALVGELNKILESGRSLYSPELFQNIKLSEMTIELLASNPNGDKLVRLNRLLLSDGLGLSPAQSFLAVLGLYLFALIAGCVVLIASKALISRLCSRQKSYEYKVQDLCGREIASEYNVKDVAKHGSVGGYPGHIVLFTPGAHEYLRARC